MINRGNYRSDVFASEGAKAAFESCLFEACRKSGWLLHAFVVMRNHFHLAIETPRGNLVQGMQWLQSTFANRFNRRRGESGHLFQGRYKALLVESGQPMGRVSDYIHLNPVKAGVVPIERLEEYRYSSFWYLARTRPNCLRLGWVLIEAGAADSRVGWAYYRQHLASRLAAKESETHAGGFSHGWAIGSDEFKAALLHDHAVAALTRAWETEGAREIRTRGWEALVQRSLACLHRKTADLAAGPKNQPWKLAIAMFLKERTQASNPWLARRLGIGRGQYLSRLVSAQRRSGKVPQELDLLREKCSA
ncbi:MAG TPA: transposase [Lacunisphaera sp.]|nr:transposase [Lacunisphaera sp.]